MMPNCLDIYNGDERLVVCVDNKTGKWGRVEQEPEKYIELGKTYTLEDILVHDSTTQVWIKEFPDKVFSSCHFGEVE